VSVPLRLSRMHYPVKVLGFGSRIGIWTQGCSIGCKGCISQDTWDAAGGVATTVDQVIAKCESWVDRGQPFDGITISGGEPFDQPEALRELLEGIDEWLGSRRPEIDVLCYSGYRQSRLEAEHQAVLAHLDALIPSPYIAAKAPGGRWRGSSNQPMLFLSELGRERYQSQGSTVAHSEPEVQFVVDDDAIWFIGVPRPGDMQRLEEKLRARGIQINAVSWR